MKAISIRLNEKEKSGALEPQKIGWPRSQEIMRHVLQVGTPSSKAFGALAGATFTPDMAGLGLTTFLGRVS
jgi:hypothetical protein